MHNNIVLIGLRGSGKSTVGKLLSQKLQREHVDLDDMLVKEADMSIPALVTKHGWDYFRDWESNIVSLACMQRNRIISTGGGVILRSQNVACLRSNGTLVYFSASPETLALRIGRDPNRPALTEKKTLVDEMRELHLVRNPLYKAACDFVVDVDTLTAEETATTILTQLGVSV